MVNLFVFFQAEDGIRDIGVTGVQTCALPILIAQLRAAPEEAKAKVDAAVAEFDRTHRRRAAEGGGGFPFSLVFWGLIFLFVILPMFARGGRRRRGPWGGRRYGGSELPIILWTIANEMNRGSRRRGSGGGFGGVGGFPGGAGGRGRWGGGRLRRGG